MKCAKCGAEIRKGNLYCSKCGTEVQIVSADNVMEEEFFLDFQRREMRGGTPKAEPLAKTAKNSRQNAAGWIVAAAGALCLIIISALFFAPGEADAQAQTVRSDTSYDGLILALAKDGEEAAEKWLQGSVIRQNDPTGAEFWQAWLYGRQADAGEQIRTLQEILAGDETNVYACRELILIYVEQQDFEALHEFYEIYEDTALAGLFADYLVAAPEIETPQEPFWEDDTLTITAQEGLNIYYTLDGSSPVTNGTLYYAPLRLEAGQYTIAAAACNEEGYYSPVAESALTVKQHYQLGMPQVTPDSGEYLTPQTIYVSVPEGCNAYYTWNGQTPTTSSARYSGGISMPEGNNVLSVIIVDAYGNESSIQRVNYIYMP